jgi:hypothetical protein
MRISRTLSHFQELGDFKRVALLEARFYSAL